MLAIVPVSAPTYMGFAGSDMTALTRCKLALVANVLAIGLLLAYVASLAVPASEATRIRNAMLIDTVTMSEIDWTPTQVPSRFKQESRAPSALFVDVVRRLGVDSMGSDWEKALALAGHLTKNARDLGAIQADLDATYRAIVDEGRGYCADYTQVYLGLAHAAGLFAREWGFSFDGFGGHGHAVIEVFDRQRARWLLLDVYNNVHAVNAATREPLSAAEFRAFVRGDRSAAFVQPNGPGRLGYKHTDKLVDYYRRGAAEWYLWAGNAVVTYESSSLVRLGGALARPVEQILAIAAGVHPRIHVVPTDENRAQIERMTSLRSTLASLPIVLAVLFVTLAWLASRTRTLAARKTETQSGAPSPNPGRLTSLCDQAPRAE
jgi:hypothetical protein